MANGELSLIDKDVSSLLEVPLSQAVTSLNLHCNRISRMEALTAARLLRHLDLSSNHIARIDGLASLSSLRTLNLSCNLIAKVEGLEGLVNLTRLNLSYNKISSLTGLLYLHGAGYKLKQLSLHSNRLDSINHLLQCMLGVQSLREVTLSLEGEGNPVCSLPAYREAVMQSLPQICVLDGVDRLGNAASVGEDSPGDIPGLEDYVDYLFSSETSGNEQRPKGDGTLATRRIDEVLTRFHRRAAPGEAQAPPTAAAPADGANERRIGALERQVSQLVHQAPASEGPGPSRGTVQRAKRDIDPTSESEKSDSEKENRRSTRAFLQRSTSCCGSTSVRTAALRTAPARSSLKGVRARRSDSDQEHPKHKGPKCAVGPRRRAQAPSSAAPGGTARGSSSKTTRAPGQGNTTPTAEEETYRTIVEERDQERERRWKAEQATRRLTEQLRSLQSKACEEKDLQDMALHTTDRLKEMLLRERVARSDLQGQCDTLALQLEEARADQEHHKRALCQLEESVTRTDTLRALQQAEEGTRAQEGAGDEFRMALTIEAARFSEVKGACDHLSAELSESKASLAGTRQKESRSSSLVQELTAMVKEQKRRISELTNAKKEAVHQLK
ncbi:hypothetical protein NHX12_004477, partial [Muraenolepis orangiensis]